LAAAAWIVGALALFALYLRISFTGHVTSDGANNALQAWDMWHGHLLLHGWIMGDATYYTFELPVLWRWPSRTAEGSPGRPAAVS